LAVWRESKRVGYLERYLEVRLVEMKGQIVVEKKVELRAGLMETMKVAWMV
jgi:hypothetical protein